MALMKEDFGSGKMFLPKTLDEREQRVYKARRILRPKITLATLAKELGISRERVRQIEVQAVQKIQAILNPLPVGETIWTMQIKEKSKELPSISRQVIEQGQEAWKHIRSLTRQQTASYRYWQAVNDALEVGERLCTELTGETSPSNRGGRYTPLMSAWLNITGFSDVPHSDRTWLKKIRQNQADVETFRSSLPPDERAKLSRPDRLWSRYTQWKEKQPERQVESVEGMKIKPMGRLFWKATISKEDGTVKVYKFNREGILESYRMSRDASLPLEQRQKAEREFARDADELLALWKKTLGEDVADAVFRHATKPQ
jgi:Sigma-70, region 4